MPVLLRSLIYALVLCIGALLVIDGNLALGSLVAFQTLLGAFIAPVANIVAFTSLLQHAQNLIRRLDDVLDEPIDLAAIRACRAPGTRAAPLGSTAR